MLRIRLQRRGKKNYATYRIVVADQHAPIKGRFIEDLGFYNPHTDEFKIKSEDTTKWIGNGAKPTSTVHNLLVTHEVIKGDKVTSWRPKKKKEEEEKAADKKEKGKKEEKKEEKEEKKKTDEKDGNESEE
jgi:small subunit ribosomal protein S16